MAKKPYRITPACYIFTHQYLNTMQQGIQTAHAIAEFIHQFQGNWDTKQGKDLIEWSAFHKTLRILNAGSGELFDSNRAAFAKLSSKYELASASFREPDINNMVTAFGFIVPPALVEEIEVWRYDNAFHLSSRNTEDHEMAEFLMAMPSAR